MLLKKEKVEVVSLEQYTYRFSWIHLTRPMTWTGTVTPVLAGTALASNQGPVKLDIFAAILLTGLFVQAAINLFNDYFDLQAGQDQDKWAGPGDPAYGQGPRYYHIPFVACSMIFLAVIISLWLASQSSFWIVAGGFAAFIFGFAYSGGPRPLCSVGLGEFQAFVCIGLVPATIAYAVQGYSLNTDILGISMPFALLISSMILSNNIRDLDKDKGIRRTLPMIIGRRWAVRLLTILLSLAYLSIIVLIITEVVSWMAGICILALPLAVRLRWSFRKGAPRADELSGMKWSALHHWGFGLLFALAVWLS